MYFTVSEKCPRCGEPVTIACVELDPVNKEQAFYFLECIECGRVGTKAVSLIPEKEK